MSDSAPELSFKVRDAELVPFAASPQLALNLEVTCTTPAARVESILLRCAVRIQAGARKHQAQERARLTDLFGESRRLGTFVQEPVVDARAHGRAWVRGLDDGAGAVALQS